MARRASGSAKRLRRLRLAGAFAKAATRSPVRTGAGQTVTIEKGDLKERGKRDVSMMSEGLLNGFTTAELANPLAYLESRKQ